MKTILHDEENVLEITDEGFDTALPWVVLKINNKESVELPLRHLMGALIGFDAKRQRFNGDE